MDDWYKKKRDTWIKEFARQLPGSFDFNEAQKCCDWAYGYVMGNIIPNSLPSDSIAVKSWEWYDQQKLQKEADGLKAELKAVSSEAELLAEVLNVYIKDSDTDIIDLVEALTRYKKFKEQK